MTSQTTSILEALGLPDGGPTRPPLAIFDTLGHGSVVVAIVAGVVAVSAVLMFRFAGQTEPVLTLRPYAMRIVGVPVAVCFVGAVFGVLFLA